MKILSGGKFSLEIGSEKLSKGLRKYSNQPRHSSGLTVLAGIQGKDGTLQRIIASDFTRLTGAAIDGGNFPWPQIYRLDKHYIICNQDSIVEYDGSAWTSVISGLTPSTYPWYVAASYDWVYLTNGKVAVVRDPETQTYALDSTAPVGLGVCNYKGQILVGDQQI